MITIKVYSDKYFINNYLKLKYFFLINNSIMYFIYFLHKLCCLIILSILKIVTNLPN